MTIGANNDTECTECGGKGFFMRDVSPSHPDFGKPIRCENSIHNHERADYWLTLSKLSPAQLDTKLSDIEAYKPWVMTPSDDVYVDLLESGFTEEAIDERLELAELYIEAIKAGKTDGQLAYEIKNEILKENILLGKSAVVTNTIALNMARAFLACHSRKSFEDKTPAPFDKPRGWFYVWGTNGNAKSVMLTALFNGLRTQYDMPGYFCKLPQLIGIVREAFDEKQDRETAKRGEFISRGKEGRIEALSGVPVLAIDEFDLSDGKLNLTPFVTETIQSILDARYDRAIYKKDCITLFASNSSPNSFPSLITDRIQDGRFWEVRNTAPSRRPFMTWDDE